MACSDTLAQALGQGELHDADKHQPETCRRNQEGTYTTGRTPVVHQRLYTSVHRPYTRGPPTAITLRTPSVHPWTTDGCTTLRTPWTTDGPPTLYHLRTPWTTDVQHRRTPAVHRVAWTLPYTVWYIIDSWYIRRLVSGWLCRAVHCSPKGHHSVQCPSQAPPPQPQCPPSVVRGTPPWVSRGCPSVVHWSLRGSPVAVRPSVTGHSVGHPWLLPFVRHWHLLASLRFMTFTLVLVNLA